MLDSSKNYKFDLGVKGLIFHILELVSGNMETTGLILLLPQVTKAEFILTMSTISNRQVVKTNIYQKGDYYLIHCLILLTHFKGILWQSVRGITKEILGEKG